MSDGESAQNSGSESKKTSANASDVRRQAPISPGSNPPAANEPKPDAQTAANNLTAEEQMALYEKELKESDWGHQPC